MKKFILNRQLLKNSKSKSEVSQLSSLANKIGDTSPKLSKEQKNQIAVSIGFKPAKVGSYPKISTVGATLAFLLLIFAAQFARPGSNLYALKQKTEEVREIIQPGYTKPQDDDSTFEDSSINGGQDTNEQENEPEFEHESDNLESKTQSEEIESQDTKDSETTTESTDYTQELNHDSYTDQENHIENKIDEPSD